MDKKRKIFRWSKDNDVELSENSVRLKFGSPLKSRIKVGRYDRGEEFSGTFKQGYCYLLEGDCVLTIDYVCQLRTGDWLKFERGNYSFVAGKCGAVVVWVWDFIDLEIDL